MITLWRTHVVNALDHGREIARFAHFENLLDADIVALVRAPVDHGHGDVKTGEIAAESRIPARVR